MGVDEKDDDADAKLEVLERPGPVHADVVVNAAEKKRRENVMEQRYPQAGLLTTKSLQFDLQ